MNNSSQPPAVKPGIGHLDYAYTMAVVAPTVDFWHWLGFTPNGLTTLGCASSLASLYYYNADEKAKAFGAMLLRQYFDYADGILARKYKQTSPFGDYYDHINDWIWFVGMLCVTMRVYPNNQRPKILLAVVLVAVLFTTHMSCIEKANAQHSVDSDSLDMLRYLQPACHRGHEILRFFDNTVVYFAFALLIYYRPPRA